MSTPLKYEQIIYGSTRRSADTGRSGFGLRAFSSGLTADNANEIVQAAMVNYSIPTSHMATSEDVEANEILETRYPSLLTHRKVTLASGETYWVVARTLYVVYDYGFFAEIDEARRQGSNYVAHLAVFESEPPLATIASMLHTHKFIPADIRITPANAELREITAAESFRVSPDVLQSVSAEPSVCNPYVILALIQNARNRRAGVSDIQAGVVIKARAADVPSLIASLDSLPADLRGGLSLQANTLYSSGVPEELDIVIVNETNPTPIDEDFYVVADLLDPSAPRLRNVETSYLGDRIVEHALAGNREVLDKTIDLALRIDSADGDEQKFAYDLMTLTRTSRELAPSDLTPDWLRKINSTKALSPADRDILWQKVNRALNGAFSMPADGNVRASDLRQALDVLNNILSVAPEMVRLEKPSILFVKRLVFSAPETLSRLIPSETEMRRLENILYVLGEDEDTVPPATLLESLRHVAMPTVWKLMLRYGFHKPSPEMEELILTTLLESPVENKAALAAKIIDPSRGRRRWTSLLTGFLNPAQARTLGSEAMITSWLDDPMQTQAALSDGGFEALSRLPDLMDAPTLARMRLWLDIYAHRPVNAISTRQLMVAMQMLRPSDPYVEQLVASWIATESLTPESVARMLDQLRAPSVAAGIFERLIWPAIQPEDRQAYVTCLLDDSELDKTDPGRFQSSLRNPEVVEMFSSNSGMISSLKRKISKFLPFLK